MLQWVPVSSVPWYLLAAALIGAALLLRRLRRIRRAGFLVVGVAALAALLAVRVGSALDDTRYAGAWATWIVVPPAAVVVVVLLRVAAAVRVAVSALAVAALVLGIVVTGTS